MADTASGLQLHLDLTCLNVPILKLREYPFPICSHWSQFRWSSSIKSGCVEFNSRYLDLRDLSVTRNVFVSKSIASPSYTCDTVTGNKAKGSLIPNLNINIKY